MPIRADSGDSFGAAWSPDGRRIAFSRNNYDPYLTSTLFVMDGRRHKVELLGSPCNPRTPAWSPDGKRLAFACDDGVYTLRLADRKLTRVEKITTADDSTVLDLLVPSWSPDGLWLAVAQHGRLEIVSASGAPRLRLLAVGRNYNAMGQTAWSPDNGKIAYTFVDTSHKRIGSLHVIDRNGHHTRFLSGFTN